MNSSVALAVRYDAKPFRLKGPNTHWQAFESGGGVLPLRANGTNHSVFVELSCEQGAITVQPLRAVVRAPPPARPLSFRVAGLGVALPNGDRLDIGELTFLGPEITLVDVLVTLDEVKTLAIPLLSLKHLAGNVEVHAPTRTAVLIDGKLVDRVKAELRWILDDEGPGDGQGKTVASADTSEDAEHPPLLTAPKPPPPAGHAHPAAGNTGPAWLKGLSVGPLDLRLSVRRMGLGLNVEDCYLRLEPLSLKRFDKDALVAHYVAGVLVAAPAIIAKKICAIQ